MPTVSVVEAVWVFVCITGLLLHLIALRRARRIERRIPPSEDTRLGILAQEEIENEMIRTIRRVLYVALGVYFMTVPERAHSVPIMAENLTIIETLVRAINLTAVAFICMEILEDWLAMRNFMRHNKLAKWRISHGK
jgi:hypothetical protein